MEVLGGKLQAGGRAHAGKVLALQRIDAPEGGKGKPCGESYIPKSLKCSKPNTKAIAVTAVGVGVAALAVGLYSKRPKLSRQTRQELRANNAQSKLTILGTNKKHDIVTAKFNAANEYISLSSLKGRDIEVRAEKYRGNQYIITFAVDKSLTRTKATSTGDSRAILNRVHRMISEQVKYLPQDAVLYAEPINADRSGRARSAIYQRWGFRDAGDGIGLTMPASSWRSLRNDAPERGKGKPCGASHIPKAHKCSKGTGTPINNNLEIAAKIAVGAGLLAGGVYLAKPIRNKQRPPSMEEWRKSPLSVRNNPKLSPEDAQRIADEAIAGGQIWDVQEKINARRRAERAAECGGGLGKTQAPAKFDALVPRPLCQAGEGAFGTYFVHQSEKYGVKLFRNGDEDDAAWEFDRLDRAHGAGVNVPQPLRMNATRYQDGDVRAQTLVLSHMRGYKTIDSAYGSTNGDADRAPRIVQVQIARQFRKLHIEGLAHGDIHSGNIMVNPRSKKVAIIDFGYSTNIDDYSHPVHQRSGIENLRGDLIRLPDFLGFEDRGIDFIKRHRGVLDNIEIQANDYSRSWEKYELAVGRYHDALERELLWDERRPRSRFISGADQPRIPGLTRRLLTANMNTRNRELIEPLPIDAYFQSVARNLGVKPARLFRALKPERDARLARQRQKPFGTPLQPSKKPAIKVKRNPALKTPKPIFPLRTPRRPKPVAVRNEPS